MIIHVEPETGKSVIHIADSSDNLPLCNIGGNDKYKSPRDRFKVQKFCPKCLSLPYRVGQEIVTH